jgi:hypothetical protein
VITGNICVALSARALKLPRLAIALGLVTEPSLFCVTTGQSGMFVSAFLLIALGLAQTRPSLAGFAAACVVIKPQFALLLPVCFLAARNWRALAAAAVSLGGLCALTTILFGWRVWPYFATKPVAGAENMVVAAWPAQFEIMMVTPFVMLRSFHLSLPAASAAQLLITITASLTCWWLWAGKASTMAKLAPTLCLVMLATPYGYIYDMPALGFALAGLAVVGSEQGLMGLTLLMSFTSIYALLSEKYFSSGALFIAAILAISWPALTMKRVLPSL